MVETTEAATWDVNDVSVSIGGIEVPDLQEIAWDPDPKTALIKSIKGPVGYSFQQPEEPSWSVTVKSTCDVLSELRTLKDDRTQMTVTISTPTQKVNCYSALITKIAPTGAVTNEAPDIKIEGFALKIVET